MADKFYVLEQQFERSQEREHFAKAVSALHASLSAYGSRPCCPLL